MTAQALYRFFDDGGQLLYVGITSSPGHRFDQHAGDKVWWPEVRGITLQWYATRLEVEAAEKRAIKIENPRWNVVHRDQARAPKPPVPTQRRTHATLRLTNGHELVVGFGYEHPEYGRGILHQIATGGPEGTTFTVDFGEGGLRTWPLRPELVP